MTPDDVLTFWLTEIGPDRWYAGGHAVDSLCHTRFAALWHDAHEGRLDHWRTGPRSALAYLVLCDQIPRNIHRGAALAFATDARALAAARQAIAAGWDMMIPEPERQFFYMPFEHSEDPADQTLAVQLLTERLSSDPEMALHARAHREVIRRFGRFPSRNAALGRITTATEQAFLDAGGYPALVKTMTASHAPGA
jgi:uncharacterized protein (DUF924 family)